MNRVFLCILLPIIQSAALAASVDYSGGTYTENFNGLPSTGPNPTFTGSGPFEAPGISGWDFSKIGGTGANALFQVNTGASNSGSMYSYGLTDDTDRALGTLASGSGNYQFGLTLVNTTGTTLTSFSLSFLGEQWRYGGTGSQSPLTFSYGINAVDINTGSFINVPELDISSPVSSGTAGALNGNLPENQTSPNFTVTSLLWQPGQTLTLRWSDINNAGNDDGLAIDDLSFSALAGSFNTLQWNAPGGTWDTSSANWTGGTGVYANGDIVQFLDGAVGVVNIDAGGVSPLQVQVGNTTGTYRFQGGPITGGGSLVKTGAGVLEVSSVIDLTGGIAINDGTLRTLGSELLSDTATVAVGEGATLDLGANFETIGSLALTGGTVAAESSGLITIAGGVTVLGSATTSVIQGVITSAGSPVNFNVADGAAAVDLRVEGQLFGGSRMVFGGVGTTELLGDNSAFVGGVTLNTGALKFASGAALGTGSFFFNGGTLIADGDMSGATAITTPVSVGGNVVIDATNGAIEFTNFASFFGSASKTMNILGEVTISGDVTGSSVINKTGTGLLVIAGLDDSTGRTTVAEGTLKIATTANFTNTGFIRVDPGATLDASEYGSAIVIQRIPAEGEAPEIVQQLNGGGTVLAPTMGVQVDGILAPGGVAMGTLTQTLVINGGPVTLTSSGDFVFEIADAVAFDQLAMDGLLTLEGDLVLSLLDGFAPDSGTTFAIVMADGGIDGMFANVEGGRVDFAEGSFQIDEIGNEIVLSDFEAIPEPGVIALLSMGAGGLLLARRRGRARFAEPEARR